MRDQSNAVDPPAIIHLTIGVGLQTEDKSTVPLPKDSQTLTQTLAEQKMSHWPPKMHFISSERFTMPVTKFGELYRIVTG